MTIQKTRATKSAATRHVTHSAETTAANPETSPMPTKIRTKTKTSIPTSTPTSTTTSPQATTTTTTAAPNLGLSALVTQLSAALDAAEAQLGPEPTISTAAAKRHTGKPRKGADAMLVQLAPVVKQFGLDSTSLNTEAMLARHAVAQTLVPLQSRLQKISKRVGDEVFGAQTDAWDMGLQFYSLLQRRAKTDGNIAQAIAPLTKSFSYRHASTKVGKTTKVGTRVKARLKATIELAEKHGVAVTLGTDGGPVAIAGTPQAVQAAQAQIAASPAPAPVASAAPSAPAVAAGGPVAPGAAPATTANAAGVAVGGHS